MPRFTPTALASHPSCPHLTQLDRLVKSGALKLEFRTDPRVEALQMRGDQHEAAYIALLESQGRKVDTLKGSKNPADTLAAMKAGHDAIVQAPLGNDEFFGIADVLLRCDKPSALGAWSYEAVDTKLARETRASALLQLVTYCDLLATMQGALPERFHVVTPLQEEAYRLADYGAYHRLVKARFLAAATADPTPETYPDPVSHCDVCRFWKHCDERRRKDDHPSLIAGIRGAHVREFHVQGIPTVEAIAACGGALPEPPKRGRRETYGGLGQQAKLQVQARAAATPPREHLPLEAGKGFARLPEPSPGDIFLDFEGDPFAGDNGLEYLTGYHYRDKDRKVVLTQDWAFDAKAEKVALERFIDFAGARWKEHSGLHIYHFGAYEPSTLKRLCARHETRGEELDRFLRAERFIDLHVVVREAMRIGVERYGLKELESQHGFVRKQDLAEAGLSRRDVEIALEFRDFEGIDAELRGKVERYNAEDCYSTEALRDWLEGERAQVVAAGTPIDRPAEKAAAPSEEVDERDKRIQALKNALAQKLPEDPAAWTDEHRAIALLASMLGYFRQEEKNAWWEHFRLRDLPPEEHMDEREMLAGLVYVETLPKATPRERNERRRYRFPPQECAIKAGDTVKFIKHEDPDGLESVGSSLTVQALDPQASTVVLSSGKFAKDANPTAVFGDQIGPNMKKVEGALFVFADDVVANGFSREGPFAAAAALLLRKPPIAAGNGSLRGDAESTLDAAKRLALALDGGVLPVQGPPGAGKTFTGARVILDLARRGKRIGVTAVSHKVIDNLLLAIRDAIRKEGGSPVRLVHKSDGDAPDGIEYVDDNAGALASAAPGTVVGATVFLWAHEDAPERLDYLFVDEAGQMSLVQALAASRSARNVVLLGDPQQLEQPQRGAHPDGADVAALVHIVGDQQTLAADQGLFLDTTYRLHPSICGFTSELYYEGKLAPVAGLDQQRLDGSTPFAGAGLFFVEVPHEGNQAVAPEEVDAVERVARSLLDGKTTWTDCEGKTRPLAANDILVVAPYNAQVSALRDRLAALGVTRVGTVDKFQGQEAPVVIYSCASSSPEDAPRGMAFLYDPHRFNVATSRAQGVVVVVASPKLFEPECRTPEQLRWANGLCRYREIAMVVTI
jgi:predicted RecB family nuclease